MHCAALLFTQRVRSEPTTLEGVFDEITAPSFPATVPDLTIWARLFYEAGEAGHHELGLSIWDMSNGERIGTSGADILLPARPERGHPSNDITFNISNSQIPHPGEYEFRLMLDSEVAGSVWLTVTGVSSLN